MDFGDYIYLHFLDRELRGSLGLGNRISDAEAKEWVKTALFMTDMPLYVSLSHMYESSTEFPNTISFLFQLEKLDFVRMVSNHSNLDEFLESRKNLYSFDKDRYGQYFNHAHLEWPKNIHNDGCGTTEYLKGKILSTADTKIPKELDEKIKTSLIQNSIDAITIQRFLPLINKDNNSYYQNQTQIRILISSFYTQRYLKSYDGTIITGLPGFEVYDHLAKKPVYTDYRIFRVLTKNIWTTDPSETGEAFITLLSQDDYKIIKKAFWLACDYAYTLKEVGDSIDKIVVTFRNRLSSKNGADIHSRLLALNTELNNICKERGLTVKTKTFKFLIMIATQLELDILLAGLKKSCAIEPVIGEVSYLVTSINGNHVYVMKCQMGASGAGGATLTADNAIAKFDPDAVIMCGIAWGVQNNGQKIGDVLISTKVWEYDPFKKNERTDISRGSITPSSAQLIQAFEMVAALDQSISIHFGLIASGSLLLNNKDEVERLLSIQPEIIGGEMEIAGVASACERRNKKWIMVKGICDWGYDKASEKKDEYQKQAASNAAHTLIEMLQRYSV